MSQMSTVHSYRILSQGEGCKYRKTETVVKQMLLLDGSPQYMNQKDTCALVSRSLHSALVYAPVTTPTGLLITCQATVPKRSLILLMQRGRSQHNTF